MNIIVIGAGPMGIMASISIKKNNPSFNVTLLEKEETIGSRIKVSGNGRCNLGNININEFAYNHPSFVIDILKYQDKLFSYLEEVGFSYFHDEEGRIYPMSETSTTLIYSLTKLLNKYGVNVLTSSKVTSINKVNNKYEVRTENTSLICDKLVISIGGIAKTNSLTNYENVFKNISSNIVPFSSSLTPIKTDNVSKNIEGKRAKANVKLFYKDKLLFKESGEILFKKDGVSGIVIFNVSSILARFHLTSYKDYYLSIDLLPKMSEQELRSILKIDKTYNTLFHPSIAKNLFENKINPKDYRLNIKALYDLSFAQVSSGGININEINLNLSLKNDPNIFVGGEEIDIDGICGGYNIEFAFLCGIKIGEEI